MQQAAPFSHDQGCANSPFRDATKKYIADYNTAREAHVHDDVKSCGSETDAIFPFPGEAAGHKNGPMLHRKVMWQDQPTPHDTNPLNRLTYRKQAENLSVGNTKSYGSWPLLVIG